MPISLPKSVTLEQAIADLRGFDQMPPEERRVRQTALEAFLPRDRDDLFFIGHQLPLFGVMGPLRGCITKVETEGVSEAAQWFRKVTTTKVASVYRLGEVRGIKCSKTVKFGNGVICCPWDEMPNFRMTRQISELNSGPLHPLGRVSDLVGIYKLYEGVQATDETVPAPGDILNVVTAMSAISRAAPVLSVVWQDFADPDLLLLFHYMQVWTGGRYEGTPDDWSMVDLSEHTDTIDRALLAMPIVGTPLSVALRRLNLARRRMDSGDSAIDGCIALEAIYGDANSKSEMTHKVAVRAAKSLENTLEGRKAALKAIKAFYDLRSKTVHGGSSKGPGKDREVSQEGLLMVGRAIEALVKRGRAFDVSELDLG